MKFLARYWGNGEEYFRTIFADSVNEVTRIAERFCKKGFMLHSVISQ